MNPRTYLPAILLAFTLTSPFTFAAEKKGKKAEPAVALTDAGKALETKYVNMQKALQQEIESALPKRDDAKATAWLNAIKAEEVTVKDSADKAGAVAKLKSSVEKLRQIQENEKKAPKTFAEAKDELEEIKATGGSNPELEKLLESEATFLAHIKKEQEQLQGQIVKAMAAAKDAESKLPEAIKAAAAAKQAHEKSMAATWLAMDAMGMNGILGSDKLDGKLARYIVITSATPIGLAEFAQRSLENEQLIQQLLSNEALMVQMLVADGLASGKFGEAMKIYTDIQKASPKAKDGLFQRLALAVSLAHATPILKQVPIADKEDGIPEAAASRLKDASQIIDPVKRYLSYEKWYQDGELDQGFKDLSVWDLTMVVNGDEPDEIMAWGRQMLNNLRPECIPNNGNTAVYVDVVDKEIAYTSSMVKNDLPEVAFMQNVLANGGVCGRRAFFGRFILRAFGVPTAARKQPGHATLAHWHPEGWQTKLGGDWGLGPRGFYSSMNSGVAGPYDADVNFLASTEAREDAIAFMRVKRAQWIGELVGEGRKPGLITFSGKTKGPAPKKKGEIEKPIFWNDLALHEQRRIIAKLDSVKSASPTVAAATPTATGKITVDDKGVITIPSAACSNPLKSINKGSRHGLKNLIAFVKNKAGETHLHLSRYAEATDSFEYTFDAPKAGKYKLTSEVVTPMPNLILFASANGGADVKIEMPYTIGMWDKTAPVVIELKAGKNVLKFHGPSRVTTSKFTLTPAG